MAKRKYNKKKKTEAQAEPVQHVVEPSESGIVIGGSAEASVTVTPAPKRKGWQWLLYWLFGIE